MIPIILALFLMITPVHADQISCGDDLKVTNINFTSRPVHRVSDYCTGPYNVSLERELEYVRRDYGSDFVFLDQTNGLPGTGLGGVVFDTLATESDPGFYTITWFDTTGKPDLPFVADLVIVLRVSNKAAFYQLNDVLLNQYPDNHGFGFFNVMFSANGSTKLSNLALYGRVKPNVVVPPAAVPEPIPMLIILGGLLCAAILKAKAK